MITAALLLAISGTVFSTTGTPVENARVTVYRPETIPDARARIVSGTARPALASATTDANGAFSLDPKRDGVFDLFIERDGFAPRTRKVVAGETDLTIDLDPAAQRTGHVTAAGKPVSGALVVVDSAWSVKTDERGAFTIPDPKSWAASLAIVHPDYTILEREVPQGAKLEFTLLPGTAVRGNVVAATGRPAANARVLAGDWPVAISGEDGSFVARHVGPDAKTITAIAGSESGSARGAETIEIKLVAKRVITGTVRDSGKRPLPGALVTAYHGHRGEIGYAITDEKGAYRIEHCTAASYQVIPEGVGDFEFSRVTANLTSSESARADFTATATTWLRGTVVDERKRPIAGATVQHLPAQIPILYAIVGEGGFPRARTASDGRFKLPSAAGANDTRLQTIHPRYAATVTKVERGPLMITLRYGMEVRGVVVDSEGKPVAGAGIAAMQDPFGAAALPIDAILTSGSGRALFESDAEGKFTLHLNEAPHDVTVWKEGFVASRLGSLTPARGQDPLRVVLERGVEIRGRVVAKGVKTEIDGVIVATGDDGSYVNTMVGSDGTFVLGSLRPGVYSLEYNSAFRRDSESKEVRAPASDVVIELAPKAEIRGRVTDKANGRPVSHYSVRAEGAYETQEHGGDEMFTLAVPAGVTHVMVDAEGYLHESMQVVASLDKPAEVTFALTRGRTISGRVTSDAGLPLAQAMITPDSEDIDRSPVETGENGEFELMGMPREDVTLHVSRPGFVARAVAVDAGDADQRVNVTLAAGRKAFGKVVTATGEPVEKATVWAQPITHAEQMGQRAETDSGGAFAIEGLAEGRYRFFAGHQQHGTAELQDVDPAAGPVILTFKPKSETGVIRGTVKGFAERGWMYAMVTTDAGRQAMVGRDGKYRIENVPAGETQVRAMGGTMRNRASTAPMKVTVVANGEVEADLEFRSDITVRGRVTEGGQPVVGRRIAFEGDGSEWETRTGEGGLYEIAGIEPGMYQVSVEAGRRSFSTRYQVNGSSTFDVAIAFAAIAGRVLDADGAPLAGVSVEVSDDEGRMNHGAAKTDANGAFSVSANDAPSFVVSASKKGFATAVQRVPRGSAPLLMRLGRTDGLRVRLVDARSGATLSGYAVATNAAGLLVGRANESAQDGAMVVPLHDGAYRVSVSANGFASQSQHVTIPLTGELRFALTPGGTLVVRSDRVSSDLVKLILPNGEEYVRCHCNGIAEIRLTGATTTIGHVAPGNYTMQVLDPSGSIVTSYPVTIAEGGTTVAEIHVPE